MRPKPYLDAACRFNKAAKPLGLRPLPLNLPRHIVRNPELLRELVELIEASVRPLQRLVDDLKAAIVAECEEVGRCPVVRRELDGDMPLALESRWRPPMRFDSATRVCEKQRAGSTPARRITVFRGLKRRTHDEYGHNQNSHRPAD